MTGALLIAVPIAALGLSPTLPVLMLAAAVGGVGLDVFVVTWETAMQEHIPTDKLSRVFAYDMLGSILAVPAGQVVVGAAAQAFTPRPVVLTAAALYVAIAVLALFTPAVWGLRRHAATRPPVVETA